MIRPALAAASVVAVGLSGPALGQQSTNMSPAPNPSVTVDLGVLDELGPTAAQPIAPDGTAPRRAAPTVEPRGNIRLTPPPPKPKISPEERSVGAPPRAPGPNVRRDPPPVPRSKPRLPVLASTKPPTRIMRVAPTAPKPPDRQTSMARTAEKTPPAPIKRDKAKTPDSAKTRVTAAPAPMPAAPADRRPEKKTEALAATAISPETPENPRLSAAIDAPMSLLHPPEPSPGKRTASTPAISASRAPAPQEPPTSVPAPPGADKAETADKTSAMPKKAAVTSDTPETMSPATSGTDASKAEPDGDVAPASARPTLASNAPAGLQQAALADTAPEMASPGGTVRLAFASNLTTLSRTAAAQIEQVAARLKDNNRLRLQLMAYANGASRSTSEARRMSLYRALAVRSHLIKTGVRSTRIDVRALGDKFGKGPPDRVDLVVFAR